MVLELPGGLFGQEDVRETTSQSSLLANKTSYYSLTGPDFKADNPDTDQITYDIAASGEQVCKAQADGITMTAPIHLPHGAVITEVIVWGNAGATAETWELVEDDSTALNNPIATANIGTADTTITNATVNNQNRRYTIRTSSV